MAIPEGKYVSKVVLGETGETLIDLTADTIEADKLLAGYTAHGANGAPIEGACTFDADTKDATALASEILTGKSAYVNGNKVDGLMANNGAVGGKITTVDQQYSIPVGYHDGSGTVEIDEIEQAKLIESNIKEGVEILGVTGNYTGEERIKAQTKTAVSSFKQQTILPDEEYDYITQLTIDPIPYSETENNAGGYTVTIGQAVEPVSYANRR